MRALAPHVRRILLAVACVSLIAGLAIFAERGRGPAVLTVHGAGGGFDQGIGFPGGGRRYPALSYSLRNVV